jgi:DNA invertase Pin-like site-specific DNA recombinase
MNTMKIVVYLRTSTLHQNLESQKVGILSYANTHSLKIDEFREFQTSSKKSLERRGIEELLNDLNEGDTLLVAEISRLGRSVSELLNIVTELTKKGVILVSIKENIVLDKKNMSMNAKIMVTLFSLMADIDNSLRSERISEGLERRKREGGKVGRPKNSLSDSKLDPHQEQIIDLLEKKVSQASIAKIFGVNRGTLINYIRSRKLLPKMKKPELVPA